MHPVLGEILGWEFLLVIAVIALLFGSSKIPQLARSLGQASKEFRKGIDEAPTPRLANVSPTATRARKRMPFDGAFSPIHWLIVAVVALLVLGPDRLPDAARSAAKAWREFQI